MILMGQSLRLVQNDGMRGVFLAEKALGTFTFSPETTPNISRLTDLVFGKPDLVTEPLLI